MAYKKNDPNIDEILELKDILWNKGKINNDQYKYEYEYILPENVNENTPVVFLHQGDLGDDDAFAEYADGLEEHINQYGADAIYVHYDKDKYDYHDISQADIINDISKEIGLNLSNVKGNVMHSAGFLPGLNNYAKISSENPDMEPQVLVSLEGYVQEDESWGEVYSVADELGKKGHILLAFHDSSKNQEYLYEYMADAGMTVVKICKIDENGKPISIGHDGYTKIYVEDGINDFQLGKGTFPPGYQVEIYRKGSDKPELIDATGMTLWDLYKECEVISVNVGLEYLSSLPSILSPGGYTLSDTENLNVYLDNVINVIKTSATNLSSNNNVTFESTTIVPTELSNVLKSFISTGVELSDKIAQDMYEFAKIGESKDMLDIQMSNELEDINATL